MNVEKQIAKLESLLGRIRRNADAPRPVHAEVATAHAPVHALVEDGVPHSALPPTARVDVPLEMARAAMPSLAGHAPAAPAAPARDEASAGTDFEDLDMMDEEIVELAPKDQGDGDLEADLGGSSEDAVPESAPRPALQARSVEAELEPPVKTPPPESGRQAVLQAPTVTFQDEVQEADLQGGADIDDLLQPDLSGGPISKAPPGLPTMEQLGETVELEGADAPGAALELAAIPTATASDVPLDDLELSLPKREFGGGYDAALAPPPDTAADLERHQREMDRLTGSVSPPSPISLAAPASFPPLVRKVAAPAGGPIVVDRPALVAAEPAEIIVRVTAKMPETFLELLDLSLALRG